MKKFKTRKRISIFWFSIPILVGIILFNYVPDILEIDILSILSDKYNVVISNSIIDITKRQFTSKMINNVDNVSFEIPQDPLIYIYNTHDSEMYLGGNLGVREASLLMKEEFDSMGLPTLVEKRLVTPYLDLSYSTFYQAYAISRKYIIDTLNNYHNVKIVIDLHRDSISREASYIKIGDRDYAKILFVQGVRYDNYKENLSLVNLISDKLNEKYPGISKGIMIKDKSYQHDSYNQDLNTGAFLLELGSNNNSFEEVTNTIEVFTKVIKEILHEKNYI